jgi:hypothetical protein
MWAGGAQDAEGAVRGMAGQQGSEWYWGEPVFHKVLA